MKLQIWFIQLKQLALSLGHVLNILKHKIENSKILKRQAKMKMYEINGTHPLNLLYFFKAFFQLLAFCITHNHTPCFLLTLKSTGLVMDPSNLSKSLLLKDLSLCSTQCFHSLHTCTSQLKQHTQAWQGTANC